MLAAKTKYTLFTVLAAGLIACAAYTVYTVANSKTGPEPESGETSGTMQTGEYALATFAGGCFWCMEPPYDELDGVVSTIVGYTGGHVRNPSYGEVSAGGTGHTEAMEVRYDPAKITYRELLDVFWMNIDPTVDDRQFCDKGSQYRAGIFYHDDSQKALAEASKQKWIDSGRFDRVVTEVTKASKFYKAEEYHQDYYIKNPLRYKFYRYNCGRDRRLEELWGD